MKEVMWSVAVDEGSTGAGARRRNGVID